MIRWLFTLLLLTSPAAAQLSMTGIGGGDFGGGTSHFTLSADPNAASAQTVNVSGGVATTMVLPALSTTNTNDCLAIFMVDMALGSTQTISDTAGLTWTQRTGSPTVSGAHDIYEYTAFSSGVLTSDVITVTSSLAISFANATAFAISGCKSPTAFDPSQSAGAVTGTVDPVLISTTSGLNDMVIGACSSGTSAPTAGSGFTLVKGVNFASVEYKVVVGNQSSLSVGWTTGSGNCHVMIADALIPGP